MLKKKTVKKSKRKTKKKIKIVLVKKPSKKNTTIKKIQLSKDIIISSISKVLKVSKKKININSGSENMESWDSLAQLSILSELDNKTKGKVFEIQEMSTASSVKEIIKVLKKKKLFK
tara:strand:- start:13540 stop:13890 length:351 start_codon:yes stop_codon:yes gene_type:complete